MINGKGIFLELSGVLKLRYPIGVLICVTTLASPQAYSVLTAGIKKKSIVSLGSIKVEIIITLK